MVLNLTLVPEPATWVMAVRAPVGVSPDTTEGEIVSPGTLR